MLSALSTSMLLPLTWQCRFPNHRDRGRRMRADSAAYVNKCTNSSIGAISAGRCLLRLPVMR